MDRIYTDQFSVEEQVSIEQRFDQILKSDSGLSAGPVANIILLEQFPEVPVSIATLIGNLDAYLYNQDSPAVLREEITGESLLQFIIKGFFPQFIWKEASYGIS